MLVSPTINPYTINDHQLAVVPSSKDLGVLVNNKLTRDLQISSVVAKANMTLGFLRRHRLRTSLFRDSFYNRVVKLWNNLPIEIRKSSSISAFKSRLYKHYFLKLRNVFDTDRLSTWKTICPSCRSIGSHSCC